MRPEPETRTIPSLADIRRIGACRLTELDLTTSIFQAVQRLAGAGVVDAAGQRA